MNRDELAPSAMDDPLRIYLHDHLAGSTFAIELLETLAHQYPDHDTGKIAKNIVGEIREDRAILETIISKVGRIRFDLKDLSAWFAERASRAKLKHDDPEGIGAFEAFEVLSLGIRGKLGLWQALSKIAKLDARIPELDYAMLAARADQQFSRMDAYRLRLSETAFAGDNAVVR